MADHDDIIHVLLNDPEKPDTGQPDKGAPIPDNPTPDTPPAQPPIHPPAPPSYDPDPAPPGFPPHPGPAEAPPVRQPTELPPHNPDTTTPDSPPQPPEIIPPVTKKLSLSQKTPAPNAPRVGARIGSNVIDFGYYYRARARKDGAPLIA